MSFTSTRSRWSDVWLATAARGIASCGDFLVASALTLALQSAGAGGLAVSGVLLAATLPLVVLAPLTGRLADRVDSRAILVVAGLAQAGICLTLAYAGHPALVIVLVALLATGLAATQPVISALVPVMVRPADLPRASALNQSAGTLGALAGPALAGLLVGQFGARPPLLLATGSYLALVVAGLLIRTRRGGRRSTDPALPGGAVAATGWRLRQDPLLVAMVTTVAGVIGAVGAINVVEVFFIRETLGSSTTMYGLVTGSWTLGILAGGWLFARVVRRLDRDATLVRAGVLLLGGCCLMVLASAAVPTALLLVPIWLVGGVFNGGNNVFNTVLMARRVPEAARGRAFAFFGASAQGAAMGGYLVGGLLLEVAAPRPLVAACGVAGLLVVAAIALPLRRAVRAATPPPALGPAPIGPPPVPVAPAADPDAGGPRPAGGPAAELATPRPAR
ncbi:MFS transporter [Micromonospora sp. C28SCA-DRY-2]|uniref:MFS transporter n=1 Tax=Micromonospora sp. C28SCA-DRY-2 TaxID=3059522 RepID=UPI00267545F9|nr:MFS transporter [Micromonospora sp. C28SCA-DRY-2]MDO3701659.1 MFS transporter [Micromonospora sp. C28SCA-DRY-2]